VSSDICPAAAVRRGCAVRDPASLWYMDLVIPTAQELGGYLLHAQHPLTRQWVDDAQRMELLSEQCADDVRLATDTELSACRRQRFAPGIPATSLLSRWRSVSDDLTAMMSMRYEGGDPSKPFVDASILSRPLAANDLQALARASADIYGGLRPRYLRLWSAAPVGEFMPTLPDRRYLAASVESLRTGVDAALPRELRLTPASTLRDYEGARSAYHDIDRQHPPHVDQAKLADYAALHESMTAGNLFEVRVDAEWAGYVSVKSKGATLGMPAYVVQELVLASKFRGRGYGAHLTTLVARALADPNRILVGTIHAHNRGAREAAERAGRLDVGGWIQVPLGIR
jgi:Acetyltransferase (GNAT) family